MLVFDFENADILQETTNSELKYFAATIINITVIMITINFNYVHVIPPQKLAAHCRNNYALEEHVS